MNSCSYLNLMSDYVCDKYAFCSVLECPDPSGFSGAHLELVNHTGVHIDDILTVQCEQGYVLQGTAVFRKNFSCLLNDTDYAVWEGFDGIACQGMSFINFECIMSKILLMFTGFIFEIEIRNSL